MMSFIAWDVESGAGFGSGFAGCSDLLIGLVEQEFATGFFFSFCQLLVAQLQADFSTLVYGRARANLVYPALEVGEGLPHGLIDQAPD